jgi:hypothetical protein
MTPFLVLLLLAFIASLAFIGRYAIRLRIGSALLESELAAQRSHYDQDQKQWNDSSATLRVKLQSVVTKYNDNVKRWNDASNAMKAEIQRLSKWKHVAESMFSLLSS